MTTPSNDAEAVATKSPRRRLGRGLGSMISSPVQINLHASEIPERSKLLRSSPATDEHLSDSSGPGAISAGAEDGIRMLALSDVHPNPRQPRQDFDEDSLKALASSIAKSGMMQPILVRPERKGGYQIIAGERRWRACQTLGLPRIHAVIRDVDDRMAAQFSLVENLQREDLNPIERAEAFQRLVDEHGLMHQDIAESIGWDRSSVTNHLRLNELDEFCKGAVRGGQMSMGHAKVLLAIPNIERRRELAGQAVKQAWSVRELEQRVKAAGEGRPIVAPSAASTIIHPHMNDLQKRLGEHLGTKVHIRPGRTKGSGQLIIEFYNLDQFEGLMTRLQFNND